MTQSPTPQIEHIDQEKPDVEALRYELHRSIRDTSVLLDLQEKNDRTRFCQWDGQSDDGRKWKSQSGKEPFPWNGCSDARVRLADEIVNEQVAMCLTAFRRSTIQSTALNSDNLWASIKVNELLRWLFRVQCRREIDAEVEIALNWRQHHGIAVLGVWWEQQTRQETVRLDIPTIVRMAGDETQAVEAMDMIRDPLREEELVANLLRVNNLLDRRAARKLVRDLREIGVAELPKLEVFASLPRWEAMRPFVDVFWQAGVKHLQRARWVAKREWLSETDLRDRARIEGWDEGWVKKALEQKGVAAQGLATQYLTAWTQNRHRQTDGLLTNDYRDLVEVWHFHVKGINQKTGAPCLYRTLLHHSIPDLWAWHGMAEYDHGRFPYVEMVRERIDTAMTESRGVTELAKSEQAGIKRQVDARTDVTDLTTLPPVIVPMHRAKSKLDFGPGSQNAERRPNEIRWLQPPMNDGRSVETEGSAQMRMDRYFGRVREDVPPMLSQLHTQKLVDGVLIELADAAKMTLQLAQQYMEPLAITRLMGGLPVPFKVTREEIRGQFELELHFDAADLDAEAAVRKLDAVNKLILPSDTEGVIDRAGFVATAMSWIDPNAALRIVRTADGAAQSEIADEQNNFALMMSGQEPPMKEAGQNYALRLQTLQKIMGSNPVLPQLVQQRPDVQAMLEARVQHFQFMLTQQQNAMIGRIGTSGGLDKMQAG